MITPVREPKTRTQSSPNDEKGLQPAKKPPPMPVVKPLKTKE
jgi:hypothetical protein